MLHSSKNKVQVDFLGENILIVSKLLNKEDQLSIFNKFELMLDFQTWKNNNDPFIPDFTYETQEKWIISPYNWIEGFYICQISSFDSSYPIYFSSKEKAEQFVANYNHEDIIEGLFPYHGKPVK